MYVCMYMFVDVSYTRVIYFFVFYRTRVIRWGAGIVQKVRRVVEVQLSRVDVFEQLLWRPKGTPSCSAFIFVEQCAIRAGVPSYS